MKIIPLHQKIIHDSLINHTYIKIIPDMYDINAQGKIILFLQKIIHGSLINHTYIKIIPDIYDISKFLAHDNDFPAF